MKGRFVKAVADGGTAAETAKRAEKTGRKRGRVKPAQEQIAEALPLIVGKFVSKAKGGSIPHAKALAALGEMDRASGGHQQRSRRREQSLTERLMRELRRGRDSAMCKPPGTE